MPLIFSEGGFDFRFSAHDAGEPPHIHVFHLSSNTNAKFWLDPVRLTGRTRMRRRYLNRAERMILAREDLILERWHDFFS